MKKQLDSLRIERFRQIKELSIPELGHVNLIVGGNNSGKSTLLEALRFYAAKASPALLYELLGWRGEFQDDAVRPEGTEPNLELSNLFFGRTFPVAEDGAIHVGTVAGDKFVRMAHVYQAQEEIEGVDPEGRPVTQRRLRKLSKAEFETSQFYWFDSLEIQASDSQPVLIRFRDLFGEASRGALYDRQVAKLPCGYVPPGLFQQHDLAQDWDEVVLTDGQDIALRALRILEPHAENLAFIRAPAVARTSWLTRGRTGERAAIVKLKGLDRPVPLQSMGDGMTRILRLILVALRVENGFLLIDEFENGLHHSTQAEVWEVLFALAQSRRLQIFATTHSEDCVRAFREVALRKSEVDGKLLKLERMPDDGRTVAAVLGEQGLSNLLDAGIEVRG